MKAAVLAAIITGLACAGISYGQEPQQDTGKKSRGQAEELLKKLELTPEQEAQVKEYQETSRRKNKELRGLLQEKRKALKEELDKPETDMEKVEALSVEMQNVQVSMVKEGVQGALQMKRILGPEQYKAFSDMLDKLHKEHSGKRKRSP